ARVRGRDRDASDRSPGISLSDRRRALPVAGRPWGRAAAGAEPAGRACLLMSERPPDLSVRGRFVRIARLAAEGYDFVDGPVETVDPLRAQGRRVDLFTFTQYLPNTTPRYDYPMEWDNVAAIRVSTFEHWRTRQVKDKTRNMLRRAERAGLIVRQVPFDNAL